MSSDQHLHHRNRRANTWRRIGQVLQCLAVPPVVILSFVLPSTSLGDREWTDRHPRLFLWLGGVFMMSAVVFWIGHQLYCKAQAMTARDGTDMTDQKDA